MAELDFSKIFGETATSKASFTDENYLNEDGRCPDEDCAH